MYSKQDILHILKDKNQVLLGTVSGVASTKTSLIRFFDENINGIDVITTKSFQVTHNSGNREPIICEPEIGTLGNSVGLRNPGMEVAFQELLNFRHHGIQKKLLNISLSASSPEDFITLIKKFQSVADIIELNFSCPHAASGYGASIGCNLDIATTYVKEIKKAIPEPLVLIFVKLTPNIDNIGKIAKSVIDAGADGITAINTVGPELYLEPYSNKPILNNNLGGKGGKSGHAVFQKALHAIREIREAIGDSVPVFGMGGIESGEQIAEFKKAGADIVGVGSVLSRVRQQNWASFFIALKDDASMCLKGQYKNTANVFIATEKQMEYIPKKITHRVEDSKDVVILTFDGKMPFSAGQFIFLWIPEVGEKPFSLALSDPMTVVIKKKGAFTSALFNLQVGDTVYVRGLYGNPVQPADTKNAILVAGGTGIAVLPQLAKTLLQKKCNIATYIGISEKKDLPLNQIEKVLYDAGSYKCIADDGKVGRVLDVLKKDILEKSTGLVDLDICHDKNIAVYLVGPMVFMENACKILLELGMKKRQIFISLEMNTMCGVGLCGECVCGRKLTCQHGTFINYEEYEQEKMFENFLN